MTAPDHALLAIARRAARVPAQGLGPGDAEAVYSAALVAAVQAWADCARGEAAWEGLAAVCARSAALSARRRAVGRCAPGAGPPRLVYAEPYRDDVDEDGWPAHACSGDDPSVAVESAHDLPVLRRRLDAALDAAPPSARRVVRVLLAAHEADAPRPRLSEVARACALSEPRASQILRRLRATILGPAPVRHRQVAT